MVGAAAMPGSRPDRDAASHPAPGRAAVGRGSLWFGLFGAPFFWSVQLIATYAVDAHTCFPQRVPLVTSSSPSAWNVVAIVISVALIGSVAALFTSIANWRATRTEKSGAHAALLDGGDGRTRFMSYAGIMLSALFTGGVVLSALALFLTPVCWQ